MCRIVRPGCHPGAERERGRVGLVCGFSVCPLKKRVRAFANGLLSGSVRICCGIRAPPKETVSDIRYTLSFIVPFCNEAKCLPRLLQTMDTFVCEVERRYPVRADAIFVDHGSTDGGREVLTAAIRAHEPHMNVRVIRLSRNFGKEAA